MSLVKSLERQIAVFAHSLTYEAIPEDALTAARLSLLDILGVTLAGTVRPEIRLLRRVIERWGGSPDSPVLGTTLRLPPPSAAILNGAAARVLDFDDVVDPLGIHPSVAVFPAIATIAALCPHDIPGSEFLTAMIIGHDLNTRLARIRKETLLQSGRYDLSKVIAATAAVGRLYGLDCDQLLSAMGIAYTSALGEAQCMVEGAPTISYQQGLVAANAVRAVLLAAEGFDGAHSFLTGRYGLFSAFEPGSNVGSMMDGLGVTFASNHDIAFKAYPTCRPNISATTLAIDLAEGRRLTAADLSHIDIATNRQIYDLVCEPQEKKWRPATSVEARFGMAYTVAVGLRNGSVFISNYDEAELARPDVLAISEKVRPRIDAKCEIPELGTHGRIEVTLYFADGHVRAGFVDIPKGSPKNPLTPNEIIKKFRQCIAYFDPEHGTARADAFINAWEHLDTTSQSLTHFLSPAICEFASI